MSIKEHAKDTIHSAATCLDSMGQFIRRNSAMGPFLLVVTIVGLILLFMPSKIDIFGVPLKGLVFVLFFLVVVWCLSIGSYFAVKKPRFLQSERFQLSVHKMDLAAAAKGIPEQLIPNVDCIDIPMKMDSVPDVVQIGCAGGISKESAASMKEEGRA